MDAKTSTAREKKNRNKIVMAAFIVLFINKHGARVGYKMKAYKSCPISNENVIGKI